MVLFIFTGYTRKSNDSKRVLHPENLTAEYRVNGECGQIDCSDYIVIKLFKKKLLNERVRNQLAKSFAFRLTCILDTSPDFPRYLTRTLCA